METPINLFVPLEPDTAQCDLEAALIQLQSIAVKRKMNWELMNRYNRSQRKGVWTARLTKGKYSVSAMNSNPTMAVHNVLATCVAECGK